MIKMISLVLFTFLLQFSGLASDNICVQIDWKTSSDSNLSASQEYPNIPFVSVNNKELYFNTVPYSIVFKNNGEHISSRSEACFSTNDLLIRGNTFNLGIVWPPEDSALTVSGTGSATVNIYRSGKLVVPLCRKEFGEGYSRAQTCVATKILDLQQIDPERAAQLQKNEQFKRLLSEANRTYGELKALISRLNEKFNELFNKSFDELSESDFVGYETVLSDALNLLRDGKKSLDELKVKTESELNQAKAKADEIRSLIEAELRNSGTDLDLVNNIDIPQIEDIDAKLPEDSENEDPFDETNDPYDKLASILIDEVTQSYPNKRFDILTLVNSWLKKKDEMEVIIQTRAVVSPKEVTAYQNSINKVYDFLLKTGCGGGGCFSSDWWFKDSPVAADTRHAIQSEIASAEPERAQKLEDALKTWQGPALTPQQEIVVASIHVLGKAFLNLGQLSVDAYSGTRQMLQRITDGAVTAAIEVGKFGLMLTPAGQFISLCEAVTGKDFCNPGGRDLTLFEQSMSAVGLIPGSGSFWRVIGETSTSVKGTKQLLQIGTGADNFSKGMINQGVKDSAKISETALKAKKSPALGRALGGNLKETAFYVRRTGEIIPAKGYRYVPSDAKYIKNIIDSGKIDSRGDNFIYISFDKFDTAGIAKSKLQVPHDAAIRIEFDTKQILENIKIPNGDWNKQNYLEPITKDFPQHGKGGATQAITQSEIKIKRMVDLRDGKILYEK